ncbi:MAG TPA: MFS transporter [Chroococcales cyanobacterium]
MTVESHLPIESATELTPGDKPGLKRDGLIFFYYALVGFNCYICSALGPVMPFLRAELSLNYRVAGLHFGSLAAGAIVAGMLGEKLLQRTGRINLLVMCSLGISVGLLALTLTHHPFLTILGVMLAGFGGSMLYQTLAAIISDRLGDGRTLAFMEAEVFAMLLGGIAPFAVGFSVTLGFGWRLAMFLVLAFFLVSTGFLRKFSSVKQIHATQSEIAGRLPSLFWAYGLVMFLSVAAEWSVAFWSADFLQHGISLAKADAAAAVGAFFIGMVAGRFSGSRLVNSLTASFMLSVSAVLSVTGFLLLWLGHSSFLCVSGLLLTGLGIANMYPLCFANAIAVVPSQASRAVARLSLLCGMAQLSTPFILSVIADRAGLFSAFSMIAAVLVVCLGAIFATNALAVRHQSLSNELTGA